MPVYEIGGQRYRFDEGISLPGAVDILVQDGTLTPEQGATQVGESVSVPETGDLGFRIGGRRIGLPNEPGSASAAQAIAFGRRLAQIGVGEDAGTAGQEQLRGEQPIATGFGENIGMFAAGPTIPGAALVGGGLEAMAQRDRFADDPAGAAIATGLEGARQAAFTAGGRIVGELSGRVVNAIAEAGRNTAVAVRSGVDSLTLPSGIRSTLGKITGNRQIQQAEVSLARNPVTARPFIAADKANEALIRGKVLAWLGQPQSVSLERGMTNTVNQAIQKMDDALPNNVKATIPKSVESSFRRLNKVATEAFELPVSPATPDVTKGIPGREFTLPGKAAVTKTVPRQPLTVTGSDLRTIISDLRRGVTSSSSTVRNLSRQSLNQLDEVLRNTDGIDQPLWREGSQQYGRWERLSRPGVISRIDAEKVNPTALFRVVEKGNKVAARSRGNVSSGDELTDDLLNTARDFERVGAIAPDSGTPTGLAVPLIVGDVAATGGIGTVTAFAAAEASQSPVGLGLAQGLSEAAPLAARAGGAAGRAAEGILFPADSERDEDN